MTTLINLIVSAWLMMLGFVAHAVAVAPEGYEDADGFHFGKEPRK